jgi:hypothetical protein
MRRILFFLVLFAAAGMCFAEKVAEFTHVFYPKHLIVTAERIYIADYPLVQIHSAKDFSHLREIGGEGQGPGEFYIDREDMNRKLLGLEIFVNRDNLFVNSMGRLSIFSRAGELVETKTLSSFGRGSGFQPLAGSYVGFARGRDTGTEELIVTLNFYDSELKRIKEIYKAPFWIRKPRANYDFFERAADSLMVRVYDGKIFLVKGGGQKFEIDVMNESGEKLYTIRRDFNEIRLDRDFIKKVHDHYRIKFRRGLEANLKMTTYPEFFPPIRDFTVADDRIYVITHAKKRTGERELIILDLEGNHLNTVWLPISELNPEHLYAYAVCGGYFYQLREDENMEKWELQRWPLPTR